MSGEGQSLVAEAVDVAGATPITVGWGIVRGQYFETMGVSLLAGRLFSNEDRTGSPGVGVFGVTAHAVAQRSREFAIRAALGAQRTHVGGLVLGRVSLLAAFGVGLGAALGLTLSTLMSGILFGVEPDDPTALVLTMACIGLTAMLASVAPVRDAVRANPADTLRAE